MICDLRQGGTITVDGQMFQRTANRGALKIGLRVAEQPSNNGNGEVAAGLPFGCQSC